MNTLIRNLCSSSVLLRSESVYVDCEKYLSDVYDWAANGLVDICLYITKCWTLFRQISILSWLFKLKNTRYTSLKQLSTLNFLTITFSDFSVFSGLDLLDGVTYSEKHVLCVCDHVPPQFFHDQCISDPLIQKVFYDKKILHFRLLKIEFWIWGWTLLRMHDRTWDFIRIMWLIMQ